MKYEKKLTLNYICISGFLIGISLFLYSLRTTLNGPHQHRQADSAFVGYFFCKENIDFLHPHIAPRGLTEGTAVNEFPIYGYALGQICRIQGDWSETTPRVFSILMATLAALFFWMALKIKYSLKPKTWLEFLTLFTFIPVNWTFFTIPMPDSTGLFFFAMAAYLWTSKPNQIFIKVSGILLFLLGFLIRPYYILLLFFFFPGFLVAGITLALSIFLFWFWYRYWNSIVTTYPGYFGIQFQTKAEILKSLPNAIAHLPVRVFEHTAIIGLSCFFLIWRKYKLVVLFYIANILMMYILKSTHIADHGYYLLNAGLFGVFVLFLGLQEMTEKQRVWFMSIFLLYTFTNTQHNFHKNNNYEKTMKALQLHGELDPQARVATYMGLNPQWLYYLKRTGFVFSPADFNGHCPEGATQYLKWSADENSDVIIKDCVL